MTVPADGSGPAKGMALAKLTVATNVVKDPEVGPAWLPWGRAIVYARNLKAEWNPIYAVDAATREEVRLEMRTRMNHDLTCASDGRLAFRAQVASWDDIFVADLRGDAMKAHRPRLASSLWRSSCRRRRSAAVKPGLEGAQDLFRRNHWEEARAHLRAQWSSLAEKDRPAATFLIGRSYVREAEFYRAVRQVGVEVGLVYLKELAGQRSNRGVALVPLFTAFYQLEAGDDRSGRARPAGGRGAARRSPPEWKAVARLRHAVALQRTGRARGGGALLAQPGVEARFWRLLEKGIADASPDEPRDTARAPARRPRSCSGAAAPRRPSSSSPASTSTGPTPRTAPTRRRCSASTTRSSPRPGSGSAGSGP